MFFLGVKKKVSRENFALFADFARENKNGAREKFCKSSKKQAWKPFFARENYHKIPRVKKKNPTREKNWKMHPWKKKGTREKTGAEWNKISSTEH